MPLIPIQPPPGLYRNGTEFQASGRWRDANLVRWGNGSMRPVGGWQERYAPGSAPSRGAIAWQDLSQTRWLASAYPSALMVSTSAGTTYDITPADLAAGATDAQVNTGFGGGFFGIGFFGTARPDTGNYSEATTWSLDTWGEYLVACSTADGRLLEWQLGTTSDAVAISGAPVDNAGLMVTEERFLFALGAGGNPRLVKWSDREDNTTWTAAATNEAGDLELQTSGQIMQGIRTRGQALILTDQDAHSATYIGGQFVYSFQRVGSSCGTISRRAAAAVDAGVFWMGQRGFYAYDGAAVQEIPCDVADYVFRRRNTAQISKVWAVSNQQHNEIWWFYASENSTECDSYVTYNYRENHWATGSLVRTAGVDRGVFGRPIWFDDAGTCYNHEQGINHDGATVYAETGPISIGAGDNVAKATMLYPDELTQGDVAATFKTRFYPNADETEHGPYSMANPTPVRFTGRQLRMRVEAQRNADWRVGVMRLDVTAGGRR